MTKEAYFVMKAEIMTTKDKQKASLDALLFLDQFCAERGIRYFLAYGTLIGAVRHHGFIPWDDDVDVHIPRPDYKRLLNEFEDKTGHFKLVTCYSDRDYLLPYGKIQNMKTGKVKWDRSIDYHQGIGIDLFPLDGVPDDLEEAERIFQKENRYWRKVVNRLYGWTILDISSAHSRIKHCIGSIAFHTGILRRSIKKLSMNPYKMQYDSAERVATVVGVHSGRFNTFNKNCFDECELYFEGNKLMAPSGYHEILTQIYGDYMRIPDEDKRVSTHIEDFIWVE